MRSAAPSSGLVPSRRHWEKLPGLSEDLFGTCITVPARPARQWGPHAL